MAPSTDCSASRLCGGRRSIMNSPDEDGRWPVRLGGLIGLETSLEFPGYGLHQHLRETKIAMLSRSREQLLTACGRSGVRASRRDVPNTVDQVLALRCP